MFAKHRLIHALMLCFIGLPPIFFFVGKRACAQCVVGCDVQSCFGSRSLDENGNVIYKYNIFGDGTYSLQAAFIMLTDTPQGGVPDPTSRVNKFFKPSSGGLWCPSPALFGTIIKSDYCIGLAGEKWQPTQMETRCVQPGS